MPPRNQPRTPLSRDRILRAALALVDADGLDAISMRHVADRLGVEAMSLYHHVASKADMLDGLFELVLTELPPWPRARSWQAVLGHRARSLRDVLRAHPNALPLFATRPAVTPGALAHLEATLDVLRLAGFSVADALAAVQVLLAYVVGHAIASYAPRRADEAASPAYRELPAELPRLREAVLAGLESRDLEREFDLGLDAMLVGLAKHARAR